MEGSENVQPGVAPQPAPTAQPAPAPQPAPTAQPAPAPQPAPEPQPGITPQGVPAPQQQVGAEPAPQPAPERCRVSHAYIWLGSLRACVAALVAVLVGSMGSLPSIFELLGEISDSLDAFLVLGLVFGGMGLLFLVVLGLCFGLHAWAYRHLWYELGPTEFNLYSGIINKRRVHVPYQRIQSVDQRATLLQRLVGVCNVSIDTAGGANNKAVLVPYVARGQAEALRTQLFARKQWALYVQQVEAEAKATGGEGAAAVAAATPAAAVAAPASAGVGFVPGASASGAPAATGEGAAAVAFPATPGAGYPTPPYPGAPANILDMPATLMEDMGGLFGGDAQIGGTVTYEYGLSNKELFLTGLSNGTALTLILLAVLAGIMQIAQSAFDLFPGSEDVVFQAVTDFAQHAVVGHMVALVALGLIAFGVVLWLLSALGACVSFGGFRARRRDDRIEVERGLLSRQFQGVSVDRVQSVVVKQSFIRRLFGYCEVSLGKIDAASDNDDGKQDSLAKQGLIVHPFVKVSAVPALLQGLIPEFADLPEDLKPLAPVALRRGLLRRCLWQGNGFWLAVFVALMQVILHLVGWLDPDPEYLYDFLPIVDIVAVVCYLFALVLIVTDAVGAVLWYRGSSFGVNRRFMQVTNSGLSRETVTFPRQKIQFGYTKTNPLQSLARTTTLVAVTAAGVGGTATRLVDVPADEGAAWLGWLEPRPSGGAAEANVLQ